MTWQLLIKKIDLYGNGTWTYSLLIVFGIIFLSFDQKPFPNKYTADESMVYYEFIQMNDSVFMIGEVIEKKSKDPIAGINIVVQQTRIGTVTRITGDFEIYLPRREGELLFHLAPSIRFNMPFEFDPNDLKSSETTHH